MGTEIGDNNRLTYNLMLLRNTTDGTQRQQGFNKDALGGEVQFTELEWDERQLLVNQLLGEHFFPGVRDLQLNWEYTRSTAESYEPDARSYRYDPYTVTPQEDDLIFSLRNDSNQRRWGELEDDSDDWNVNLVQPFQASEMLNFSINGGVASLERGRDSIVRRFAFQSKARYRVTRNCASIQTRKTLFLTKRFNRPAGKSMKSPLPPMLIRPARPSTPGILDPNWATAIGSGWRAASVSNNQISPSPPLIFSMQSGTR
jgi:hypothetical protein